MRDPVLSIWDNLTTDDELVVPPDNHSFDYPKEQPFVKGILTNTRLPPEHRRFMCFPVGLHTHEKGKLIDSRLSVLTFYQVGQAQWLYTMSESPQTATFLGPMVCCRHAVELAEKLAKGEEAEMNLTDADGAKLLIRIRPIAMDLN